MRCVLFLLAAGWAGLFCGAEEFIRTLRGENGRDLLQVAVKTYRVAEGKQIQMVGVSHIGSENYYRGLQELLDAADIVLYEGVDGDLPQFRTSSEEQSPERSNLQANLARALGLVFQLHHIAYDRDHFINSDLTSEQLLALFEGKEMPEVDAAARAELENLLEHMEQATVSGQAAAAALEFLSLRPGYSRAMRWGVVMMLGSVSGNVAEYPGLPDHIRTLMKVLIDRRNEKVMGDIHAQLKTLPVDGTLAVFYGAAHMHDFEERLKEELAAELVETEWRTAFSGNLRTSGLNLLEKQVISAFVRQQVRTLKVISTAAEKENP